MIRTAEKTLSELLTLFPAVAIIGSRQCGKTTLMQSVSGENRKFLDMERQSDRELIAGDPDLFLKLNKGSLAIDEAQLVPSLFPALRVAIDDDRRPGRFILSGSSSPDLLKNISETLAGRIATLPLAPFTFAELSGNPAPSLANCIENQIPLEMWPSHLSERGTESDLFTYWLQGGYPEPALKNSSRYRRLWFDNYINTYIQRDIARLFPGLNRERFQVFLRLLAQQSGQIINMSDTARLLEVSVPTVKDYYRIAEGTFLWRQLPSWSPQTTKRIVKHPKGFLRDSGLLHHQMHIADIDALLSHPDSGRSFEGMVIEQILRQLEFSAIAYEAFHFRTSTGFEVDLILEGQFGRVAIEVKRGSVVKKRSIALLAQFVDEFKATCGIIIYNDRECRILDDKIIGIPARMI